MKKKRIHILIATALFGVIVWTSVTLREQFQITLAIPLTIQSTPPGMAISTPIPKALQIRLRGDGWRLASLQFGSKLKLDIPYNSLSSGDRAITYNDVVDHIPLHPGVELVDVKPESVYVALDRFALKKVPVDLDDTVSFRERFGQVGPTVVTPDSVTVGGAGSVLRDIRSWPTARTRFENLKMPVETDIPLAESSAYVISLSPPTVHIHMNVEEFAEKPFNGLAVEALSVPQNREVILIPPRIDIVVRGGIKQLTALSFSEFRAFVNYTTIQSDNTGTLEPEIYAPPGIQVVSKRPDHLQYVVRRRL